MGAGYLDRNWPPALKESGAWPLASLRQSFLNGSLIRLVDPDAVLSGKIVEFVEKGDFGVGSAQKPDGRYERVWFEDAIGRDEVAFEADVCLLQKSKTKALKTEPEPGPNPTPQPEPGPAPAPTPEPGPDPGQASRVLNVSGNVPPETLEPARHEAPAEAPVRIGPEGSCRFPRYGRWEDGQEPRGRSAADPERPGPGGRSQNRRRVTGARIPVSLTATPRGAVSPWMPARGADVERATPGTRRRSCRPPWPDRPSSEPTRSAGVR